MEPRRMGPQPEIIPNQYIVVFKSNLSSSKRANHRAWAAERHFDTVSTLGHGIGLSGLIHKFNICEGAVAGYCARITEDIAKEINDRAEVDFVEPDYKIYATALVEQNYIPSWGLARICNGERLTEATKTKYYYDDEAAGEGTRAYIIDTGILAEHEDFEGRATFGYNAVRKSHDTDMNGHGTHVAGTIGSKTYGVAKKTTLIGVKVLGDNGEGSNASVIAGIQWALQDAQKHGIKKCVANMSLGGGISRALNMTVKAAVNKGLTMCVAAGNNGAPAADGSPSSEPTAITVGATAIDDTVPDWSNYGKLVDISAPGVGITSCWLGESLNETNTISGTSMATPHVTGTVAYLMSKDHSLDSPKKILARLKKLGLQGQIDPKTLQEGTVNLLLNTGERTTVEVKSATEESEEHESPEGQHASEGHDGKKKWVFKRWWGKDAGGKSS